MIFLVMNNTHTFVYNHRRGERVQVIYAHGDAWDMIDKIAPMTGTDTCWYSVKNIQSGVGCTVYSENM